MKQPHITIIGGGNMGGAMARALQASAHCSVVVIEQDAQKRAEFAPLGVEAHANIAGAPRGDVYVLAIKPQQFAAYADVLRALDVPMLVSIMAGVTLAQLQAVCAQAVRAMPNLPAAIGESMSVLCAPSMAPKQRAMVEQIFTAIGSVAWVEDEATLHAVTAISGSGPAYVFAFMEALQNAALAQGLAPALARALVMQTVKGAALLASQSADDVSVLRAQVTSKGGTTQAALAAFAAGDLEALVAKAAHAASDRSKQLASNSDA